MKIQKVGARGLYGLWVERLLEDCRMIYELQQDAVERKKKIKIYKKKSMLSYSKIRYFKSSVS